MGRTRAALHSTRFAAARVGQRVLDALATLPVRGLLTLGPALGPERLHAPENVLVRNFVPHHAILPEAQLVITHAGLSTVMAALVHGVPLVCIPHKNDQFENAARVVAAGAGQSLGRAATRRSLRRTILHVLSEPRFRTGARQLASAIGTGGASAVDELETLAAPSPRGLCAPTLPPSRRSC